ncbi:MAG: protease [Verrucomicrobia bacterium]|nr:protease [Verrucomicrobiota bacterium]
MILLGASLLAGLLDRVVLVAGLIWVAALAVAAWVFSRPGSDRWQRVASALAMLLLAEGLMTHLLPGFENPRVISGQRFSAHALPFTLYLNFDKTLAGIVLLGCCHPGVARAREWRALLVAAAPWAGATILVVMMVSLAMGYVRFDPKLPPQTPLWMWANLCFTCVAEEALFRGFIQGRLQRAWEDFSGGRWLALAVAAVLFGIAHANGGPAYVLLATIAGLGYGLVYQRTGRVEASILTHYGLNTFHFLLLTYPALQR